MRKTIIFGVALIASLSVIATGCATGNRHPEANTAATQGANIAKLYNINAHPVDTLKPGGTLRLAVSSIGPDFNVNDSAGSSSDNIYLQDPANTGTFRGCWLRTPGGDPVLNKDFCTDFKNEIRNGQQTMTIEVNPKAIWNDGTPIDYKTFQNTWRVFNGTNKDFDVTSSDYWDKITSVERGHNDKEVVINTSTPTYPFQKFFNGLIHPAINTPDIFNKGFVGKLHPEWMAGPFKIDNYDAAAKTVTEIPNEKWWGNKPILDKIVFQQLEDQAQIAAFKNGETDEADALTQSSYSSLNGTPNSQVLRGTRNFTGGMILNPKSPNLKDITIRKAIFAAVDREELRKVRFNGLNYTEGNPGSMLLMPFQKNYQDNWPIPATEKGAAKANAVLQASGYTDKKDGILYKDGKPVKVGIVNFGNDPVKLAYVKTMVKQLRNGGIDAFIDQRAANEFSDVLGKLQYDITISGYGTNGSTTGVASYYSTKSDFSVGNAELDKRITKLSSISNFDEQQKEAMNVERDYQKQYLFMEQYSMVQISCSLEPGSQILAHVCLRQLTGQKSAGRNNSHDDL